MKTLQEFIFETRYKYEQLSEKEKEIIIEQKLLDHENYIEGALNYALEAIKEDRINVAKQVKYSTDYSSNSKENDLQEKEMRNSIINAPYPELK